MTAWSADVSRVRIAIDTLTHLTLSIALAHFMHALVNNVDPVYTDIMLDNDAADWRASVPL